LQRDGSQGSSQWRVGLQTAWFQQRLFLRGGATQADASALYATAGVGGRMNLLRQAVEVDYALMVPSSDEGGAGLRQLASLRWTFGLPVAAPEAGFSRVLKDKSGNVAHARIALARTPGVDTKDWELNLRDKQGKLIKVFRGKGPLPPSVSWDGKGDDGSLANVDGVTYDLRSTDTSGKVLERHALLGPAPAQSSNLDAEFAGVEDGDGYGLRSGSPAQSAPKPLVHPALKGKQDLVVSGADFDLSSVADDSAQSWELRIVDAEGKTVKKISGQGRPPKSVKWSGTDDLGQPVQADLGSGYVLRVTGADGKEKRVADELVTPESFGKLAEKARHQSAALPCRRDPVTGDLVCTLRFVAGSAELDADGENLLARVLNVLRGVKYKEVSIEGHADGEGTRERISRLSQARADLVLKRLLARGARGLSSLTAIGYADLKPISRLHNDEGRARNRCVEIRFKEGL
jgi:outer membrane protein OmpA-like peptidoglycan-associated protein